MHWTIISCISNATSNCSVHAKVVSLLCKQSKTDVQASGCPSKSSPAHPTAFQASAKLRVPRGALRGAAVFMSAPLARDWDRMSSSGLCTQHQCSTWQILGGQQRKHTTASKPVQRRQCCLCWLWSQSFCMFSLLAGTLRGRHTKQELQGLVLFLPSLWVGEPCSPAGQFCLAASVAMSCCDLKL